VTWLLDNLKYYGWIYPFHGGVSFFPSVWWALGSIILFGGLYRTKLTVGTPFLVPGDALKGFNPTNGLSSTHDSHWCPMEFVAGLGYGMLASTSIFFKLGFFNIRIWGGSGTAALVIVNWLLGGYFLAGWIWIATHCPLWRLNCL